MPLNILWGYVALDHVDETPHVFVFLWFLGGVGTVLTLFFTIFHAVQNQKHLLYVLDDEGHAITPFSVQLQQTISSFPVITAGLAYICLFVPAAAYTMELCIAIFASTVIGSLTQYFLHALGPPPGPNILTQDLPKKRWWCGSLCGGVNDIMPGMGIYWSREPHNLTLRDLRFAFRMVNFFIWTFISLTSVNMAYSVVPRAVVQDAGGWCYSLRIMRDTTDLAVLILSILATFVGSSGLSVITAAVSMALGEDDEGVAEEKKIHVKRKAAAGQIYLQLPLLKAVLCAFHVGYPNPTVAVPVTTSSRSVDSNNWESAGKILHCPIYDQHVMGPMLYCTLVTLIMAYTSYSNFKLYLPSDREASKHLRKQLEDRLNLRHEVLQDEDEEEPLLGDPVRAKDA